MALPKRKKQDNRRYFTERDEEDLLAIAKVLGCAATLHGVHTAIESKKADFDLLRQKLGLPVTPYLAILGIVSEVERLEEKTGLEVAIQKVLRAYPATTHSRLLLTLQHTDGDSFKKYEALLVVQERKDTSRMSQRGPFTEIVEMKEAKTAILDRGSGETMTAAVKNLKLPGDS